MDKNGKKCFISFGKCDKVYILIISGKIYFNLIYIWYTFAINELHRVIGKR